jgi:LysR family transcriptional regulator, glycine cleavage system transcriptional activator
MAINSRRFPFLKGLRAFEAVARRLSFSRAAAELCVTQGAISHQIANLENELGVRLFVRKGRTLELTAIGAKFFAVIHEAFGKINDALELFSDSQNDNVLRVKVPPTLGIRWFVPLLVQFHGLHPEIDVQITTSHHPVDFETEEIDAAIHWGSGSWPGLHVDFLVGEDLTPVCSPQLLRKKALRVPRDLSRHILLRSMHRTDDWRIWLDAVGEAGVDTSKALQFENSSLTYQAAIEGLGVVVAQIALVADDLATGRLVAPFKFRAPGEWSYFLVYPAKREPQRKVALFREWLLAAAAAKRADQPALVTTRPVGVVGPKRSRHYEFSS